MASSDDDTSRTCDSKGASRSSPTKRCSAIQCLRENVTVEPALFLYCFGVFMAAPTLQNVTFTRMCLDTGHPMDFCLHDITARDDENVQRLTSHMMMFTIIAFLVPASIMSMYAGSWSDRNGRKLPLIIPPIGFIITALLLAFFNMYIESAPVWTLPVITAVNGICGGEITMIASSTSYVISKSNEKTRIQRLAIVEGVVIMGMTLGPLASGYLTTHASHMSVFFAVAGVTFFSLLYTIFCIKDIRQPPRVGPSRSYFSFMHIKEAVEICFKTRSDKKKGRSIILSLIASTLAIIPMGLDFGINYLYLKDKPLYWDYSSFTQLTALTAGLRGIGVLCVLQIIRKCSKVNDPIIGMMGAVSTLMYLLMFGLGTTRTIIFLSTFAGCLYHYIKVAATSIMSKNIEKSEEGKVFAFLSMLHNIIFIIAGSIYNSIWPITRTMHKGVLHISTCVFPVICFFIMMYLLRYEDGNCCALQDDVKIELDNKCSNGNVLNCDDNENESKLLNKQPESEQMC